MLPGPSVRSFTILGALMALLAAPLLIAQSPTTAKSPAYGGSTVTTHYNPDGSIYRIETVDAKGVLREVETNPYDSETHSLIQTTRSRYAADGTLESDSISSYDSHGDLTKLWIRIFDPQGHQTSGNIYDYQNHDTYHWDPVTDNYEKLTIPPRPAKSAKGVSYEPTPLAILIPSNLQPGERFSGSVMPAAEGKGYGNVPGFAVKMFTARLPGGEFSPTEDQGLTIATSDSSPMPVLNGGFTATVPIGTTFSLFAGQRNLPSAAPTEIPIGLVRPSWADEPVIHPPEWNGDGLSYWLDYLNYLWFKVTDYEEEFEDADADGAPNWVLDEIEDDQDAAQDMADYLASRLPLDAVRALATRKAAWERWLDDTFHGGMSLVHKDNVDYYENYAVPQDYYFGHLLRPLLSQPILQVGRLGVLRGDFSGDADSLRVDVDGSPVRFIASNRSSYYFMPPEATPGPHTLNVLNGPFGYSFPVFFMSLSMSIDISTLHTRSFPTSTMWHLTLSGLNGMPASYWSAGGGYCPDLVPLADLGTLPAGFQLNDRTRQGSIVLRVTNDSPQVIAIPEVAGNVRTWVLDAQSFAPAGVFHLDAKANALRDGGFSIFGLAVATLKPIPGAPHVPDFRPLPPGGRLPPQGSFSPSPRIQRISFRPTASGASQSPATEAAASVYLDAQRTTKAKRSAMLAAWTAASSSVRPQLLSAAEAASKDYKAAREAWKVAARAYKGSPSADSRTQLETQVQERLRKKVALERARRAVLDGMSAHDRDAWQTASTEYKAAAARQAHARAALEATRRG